MREENYNMELVETSSVRLTKSGRDGDTGYELKLAQKPHEDYIVVLVGEDINSGQKFKVKIQLTDSAPLLRFKDNMLVEQSHEVQVKEWYE
jgi:hypothetical protein